MTPLEITILTKLRSGPVWARSFQAAKPVVLRLIEQGLVCRVAPPGGHAKNQIELTEAGRHALSGAPSS